MSFVLAVIQARMTSTRLPGKVLLPILGASMLSRQIERVRRASGLDGLMVATSLDPSDDPLARECERIDVECFRGDLTDVLERFHQAVARTAATEIVRLTGDCPLLCPEIIDRVIAFRAERELDYASNSREPTFPDGMDVEVFTRSALVQARERAVLPSEHEHVTPFIWKHPELFKIGCLTHSSNLSQHRWTVDEHSDYVLICKVFERLYPINPRFGLADILELLSREPELQKINAGLQRNAGYVKSLQNDPSSEQQSGIQAKH